MKKLIALVLALVMVMALAACASSSENKTNTPADTGNAGNEEAAAFTTMESGKLIMSTNAEFPPYEMKDDNGEYIGIDVEIAAAIAEKLGLELEILDVDFDAALLAVQQGKSDIVMAGVTVNDDRKLVMNFTNTYATGKQVIIVTENSDVTLDNLGEQMIGTQRATTGYIYASGDYGDDHVTAYDNGATAVQALKNGQVNCVIIDNAPAQEFVKANPGLKILETEYVIEDYAIGVDKNNTQLLDAINAALAELEADGTIQTILDKYITAE